MNILAIDPAGEQSGMVIWNGQTVLRKEIWENSDLERWLMTRNLPAESSILAIEMIASYGMPVGKSVFETCVWIGRFVGAWNPLRYEMIYRKDVKLHLCGNLRAKDANIRRALIDRLGEPGTKKKPGPTYGIRSHEWSALAVAVMAHDMFAEK